MTPTTDQTTLGTCDPTRAQHTAFDAEQPHPQNENCRGWRPLAPAPKPEGSTEADDAPTVALHRFKRFDGWGLICHECDLIYLPVGSNWNTAPKPEAFPCPRCSAPAPAPEETARAKALAEALDIAEGERDLRLAMAKETRATDRDGYNRHRAMAAAHIADGIRALCDAPTPAAPEETTLRARVEALARKYDRLQAAAVAADIRALSDEGSAPSPSSAEPKLCPICGDEGYYLPGDAEGGTVPCDACNAHTIRLLLDAYGADGVLDRVREALGLTRGQNVDEIARGLVAALASAEQRVEGMRGERDSERAISQRWEEQAWEAERRAAEVEFSDRERGREVEGQRARAEAAEAQVKALRESVKRRVEGWRLEADAGHLPEGEAKTLRACADGLEMHALSASPSSGAAPGEVASLTPRLAEAEQAAIERAQARDGALEVLERTRLLAQERKAELDAALARAEALAKELAAMRESARIAQAAHLKEGDRALAAESALAASREECERLRLEVAHLTGERDGMEILAEQNADAAEREARKALAARALAGPSAETGGAPIGHDLSTQGTGPCLCDHAENPRKAHAADCPAKKPAAPGCPRCRPGLKAGQVCGSCGRKSLAAPPSGAPTTKGDEP